MKIYLQEHQKDFQKSFYMQSNKPRNEQEKYSIHDEALLAIWSYHVSDHILILLISMLLRNKSILLQPICAEISSLLH